MARHVLLILCILILVSVAAFPALAAPAACPDTCACLSPSDARQAGYTGYCGGKPVVCGSDKTGAERYCYEKTPAGVTTTPQPVITTARTTTTTSPSTLPSVTTTATTARQAPALAACSAGCSCMAADEGKAQGRDYCGGSAVLCGYGTGNTPQYCFAAARAPASLPVPETSPATTVVTTRTSPSATPALSPAALTGSCPDGCSCMAPDGAMVSGMSRCSGSSAACGADAAGAPMYCYAVGKTPAMTFVTGKPSPAATRLEITTLPAATAAPRVTPTVPQQTDNLFAAFGRWFSGFFGVQNTDDAVSRPGMAEGQVALTPMCERLGQTLCSGTCTDLQTDRQHCGSCDTGCYAGEICCAGTCVRNTSPDHCGSCTNVCTGGAACQAGRCDPWGCYYGTTNCNGSCVDLASDALNCGSCGNACPDGQHCSRGTCADCPGSTLACGGHCVDPYTDRGNCGSCRYSCGENEICSGKECVACPPTATQCGNECVYLNENEEHCGSCDVGCPAGQTCNSGVCGCRDPGQQFCPTNVAGTAGVCMDLRYDNNNCGSCGNRCTGGLSCCSGRCVDTRNNPDHCNGCDRACGSTAQYGPAWCENSACTRCSGTGEYNCRTLLPDGSYASHCINIQSDEENCGSCGNRCAAGELCCGGRCINPDTDEEFCGGCNVRCERGQACCGGTCIDVLYNDDHCGSCNERCYIGYACDLGRCCRVGTSGSACVEFHV